VVLLLLCLGFAAAAGHDIAGNFAVARCWHHCCCCQFCCCWHSLGSHCCWPPSVGVPAVALFPGVAGIHAFAGAPGVAGVPGVVCVLAVAHIHAILASLFLLVSFLTVSLIK